MRELPHGSAKCRGVNRRITNELRFDQLKQFEQPVHLNQTFPQERVNVSHIALVPSLQFGQGLAISIVMEEFNRPVFGDEQTAFPPLWKSGYELIRTG